MKKTTTRCSNGTLATNDSTPFIKKLLTKSCTFLLITTALFVTSCSDNKNDDPVEPEIKVGSVYILNEGNYMSSNATLTTYNPDTKAVTDDIFYKANNALFGDSPTSLTVFNRKALITISNSGKIYVIEPSTGKLTGKIIDLNSPRYIQVIDQNKAYVSNLWSNIIDIIDPTLLTKTGTIDLGVDNFAERFVLQGDYVYTNMWSYGTKIFKIRVSDNKIVDSLPVGIQPMTLLADKNGKLWTLADGGYEGNPIGYTKPEIVCIDIKSFKVEKRFAIERGGSMMYDMVMSEDGKSIYYINGGVYKMSTDATTLPNTPIISNGSASFYSIAVNPDGGDIYMSDALDFKQAGIITRYSKDGVLLDTFKAGIIPGEFAFIEQNAH